MIVDYRVLQISPSYREVDGKLVQNSELYRSYSDEDFIPRVGDTILFADQRQMVVKDVLYDLFVGQITIFVSPRSDHTQLYTTSKNNSG